MYNQELNDFIENQVQKQLQEIEASISDSLADIIMLSEKNISCDIEKDKIIELSNYILNKFK